jgi:hypothetical protein
MCRYNLPQGFSEVAAIFDDGAEAPLKRDIILHLRDGGIRSIQDTHPLFDALCYPLLFPRGENSWTIGLLPKKERTPQKYYRFLLAFRAQHDNLLHRSGRIFQQFVVDMFQKIIMQRIKFVQHNQSQLRADLYQDAMLALNSGEAAARIGRIVLPASFTGSPRHMFKLYQDSMAIAATFGKPTFFITFTCNPSWREITESLLPGQATVDRPDITCRVFKLKLKSLLNDLLHNNVLGRSIAHCYTIEFQKRGLPHAHILIWLDSEDIPRNGDELDKVISAELPADEKDPLFNTIRTCMKHGPEERCRTPGSRCWDEKKNRCIYGYPKVCT